MNVLSSSLGSFSKSLRWILFRHKFETYGTFGCCHWSANCKLANLCLWFISSANSTVLRPIAFPRSALCLRVSCKINKNYECETLSPLHHRFCCKFPRIPKKPRKRESQFLEGDFINKDDDLSTATKGSSYFWIYFDISASTFNPNENNIKH